MHLQHMSIQTMSVFHQNFFFHKLLNYFLMLQCNKHVEMNKFLCSLACTWMTIIDSQFYITDSLSEMFHWNEMLNWWLPGCKSENLYLQYVHTATQVILDRTSNLRSPV